MKTPKLSLLLSILFIAFSTYIHIHAQVGINTTTPSTDALLDINGVDKGVLIPRVNIANLSTIEPITGGSTESLLVYNTNATTGTGFYYWDSTQWLRLENFNIYNKDSFLTDAREVTQDANTLQFTGDVGRNQLTIKRTNNSTETGIAFRNSGNYYDAAIYMESGSNSGLVIATGNDQSGVENVTETVVFNDDNTTTFKDNVGINTSGSPQEAIHIGGVSETLRIESLNETNNGYNIAENPEPVYVDNDGNFTLQPPLTQTFMPINVSNFSGKKTINSSSGSSVDISMYTASITLTKESLVYINYQFSVDVTREDGSALTDGASRLFRSWFIINDDNTNHYGYDTGTYTNNPDVDSTNSVYAAGYYYLSGNAFVQLPAGTHSIELMARGFGASYDYEINFARSSYDRFQVVIQR